MATVSNEIKKKYLKQYIVLQKREREIQLEIEAVISKYTGRAVTYSDMPKGTDQHDLSDMEVEKERLEEKLKARQAESIRKYREIEEAIEGIQGEYAEREKSVLRTRYLLNITDWNVIGDIVGYSKRHVERIHGDALKHFEIPPEVVGEWRKIF